MLHINQEKGECVFLLDNFLTGKEVCKDFCCAIIKTCQYYRCNGDNCRFKSFCVVCLKRETCRKTFEDFVRERGRKGIV